MVGLVWLDLAVFLWFGFPWLGLAGFRGSPVAWFGLACLVCLVLFGWVRLNVALFPLVWFGWIWRFSVGFVGFGFVLVCSRVSARACALVGLIWLYLVGFGLIWLDLAEFGWIWLDLAWLGWIWLGLICFDLAGFGLIWLDLVCLVDFWLGFVWCSRRARGVFEPLAGLAWFGWMWRCSFGLAWPGLAGFGGVLWFRLVWFCACVLACLRACLCPVMRFGMVSHF